MKNVKNWILFDAKNILNYFILFLNATKKITTLKTNTKTVNNTY